MTDMTGASALAPVLRTAAAAALLLALPACAAGPPAGPPAPTTEQQMAWILQLEDQRILRLETPAVAEP